MVSLNSYLLFLIVQLFLSFFYFQPIWIPSQKNLICYCSSNAVRNSKFKWFPCKFRSILDNSDSKLSLSSLIALPALSLIILLSVSISTLGLFALQCLPFTRLWTLASLAPYCQLPNQSVSSLTCSYLVVSSLLLWFFFCTINDVLRKLTSFKQYMNYKSYS